MTPTLYGIRNCDTVRKARRWLDEHEVEHRFHDFRADAVDPAELERWVASAGWEAVVNRRSTSWKALAPAAREAMDAASALREISASPTLIKRPVLVTDGGLEFGFAADRYAQIFGTD